MVGQSAEYKMVLMLSRFWGEEGVVMVVETNVSLYLSPGGYFPQRTIKKKKSDK
jgi:hypothetical protein